jgi:hypothetical protein
VAIAYGYWSLTMVIDYWLWLFITSYGYLHQGYDDYGYRLWIRLLFVVMIIVYGY